MGRESYYFTNCDEDGNLSELSVKAKHIVQKFDDVIKIFEINNENLFGPCPRKALSLIRNKISASSGKESNLSDAKSYEGMPTSSRCNPDTSNRPRNYSPLDDAKKKEHYPVNLEFSTQTGQPPPEPAVETILNTPIETTGTSYEQFASQFDSKDYSHESSASAELVIMGTNITLKPAQEKEHHSTTLEFSTQIGHREPEFQLTSETSLNTTVDETCPCDEQLAFQVGSKGCQEATQVTVSPIASPELNTSPSQTIKLIAREDRKRKSLSPARRSATFYKTVPRVQVENLPEDTQVTVSPISDPELNMSPSQTLKLIAREDRKRKSLSPARRSAIKSVPRVQVENSSEDTQVNVSPIAGPELNMSPSQTLKLIAREDRKRKSPSPARSPTLYKTVPRVQVEYLPEDTQVTVSPIAGPELNVSPSQTLKLIAREDRKKKSPSPARKSATLFKSFPRNQVENSPEDTKGTSSCKSDVQLSISNKKVFREIARSNSLTPRKRPAFLKSMPRVKKLAGEEINIEVDLNYKAIDKALRSKSADYRIDSTKGNVKIPAESKSKTETSSKAPERYLRPSQRMSRIDSSINISRARDLFCDDVAFAWENAAVNVPIEALEPIDLSCKTGKCKADIEANPAPLNTIEFNKLLAEGDGSAKSSLELFRKFKNSITFLKSYVREVLKFILKLDGSDKCFTEEFKNIVRDAKDLSEKHFKMLKTWERKLHLVILIYQQLDHQVDELFPTEGKLDETLKALQENEPKLLTIFNRMEIMGMIVESIRASVSLNASDVERLTIMFVKCLSLVGILKLR